MSTLTIVLLVIALVLTAAFVALYFFTKRMEKKQDAQREQMDAMAQSMSMLIIDKKRMRPEGFRPAADRHRPVTEDLKTVQGADCKGQDWSPCDDPDVRRGNF